MKAIYSIFWLKLEKIFKNEARWERFSIDKYVYWKAKYVQVPARFPNKKGQQNRSTTPKKKKKLRLFYRQHRAWTLAQ